MQRSSRRSKPSQAPAQARVCLGCGELLPATGFVRAERLEDGSWAHWHPHCRYEARKAEAREVATSPEHYEALIAQAAREAGV